MKKIFLSYTTLDKEITIDLLKVIKNRVSNISNIFIHLLDNDLEKSQEAVINELNSSDLVILLETDRIEESKWVQIELENANKMHIPILKIKPSHLLTLSSKELVMLIRNGRQ